MKKRRTQLLILCLITVFGTTLLQAQDPVMRIDPATKTIAPAEACTLDITVDNVTNLGSFEFSITYNTAVVHATSVTAGDLISSTGRTAIIVGPDIDNNSSTGSVTFGVATLGSTNGPDGAGILAQVVFTAQGEGTTALTFASATLADINAVVPSFSSENGEITVSSGGGGLEPGWEAQNSGTGNRLYDAFAVSADVGWIAGTNIILRTTNGGSNWENVTNGLDSLIFISVSARDASNAWLSGYSASTNLTYVYRTVDGGQNWTQVLMTHQGYYSEVKMFSGTQGVVIGDPVNGVYQVLETADGGATWSNKGTPPTPESGEGLYRNAVKWVTSSECWVGTNKGKAYHSTDGGSSWTSKPIAGVPLAWTLSFDNSGNGIAAGGTSNLARTTDDGNSWTALGTAPGGNMIESLYHDGRFWLSANFALYTSSDLGDSWTLETTGSSRIRGISLIKDGGYTHGWVVGNGGMILHYAPLQSAVEDGDTENLPGSLLLEQNYPNPFNPSTSISFTLARDARVNMDIHNVHGQKIQTLLNERRSAGSHQVQWSADGLAGGIYFCRISIRPEGGSGAVEMKTVKMIYMK